MAKIAVIILTFNEEKNIADAIRSAAFADEVLLIDSGSTDETLAIARALGARVVQHPMKGFADQRNFALRETAADWVFYLDADERLTPAAGEAIRRLAEARERVAYEPPQHRVRTAHALRGPPPRLVVAALSPRRRDVGRRCPRTGGGVRPHTADAGGDSSLYV